VAGRIRAGSGKAPTEFFDGPPLEMVGRFVFGLDWRGKAPASEGGRYTGWAKRIFRAVRDMTTE
jgi:hypothetical protein